MAFGLLAVGRHQRRERHRCREGEQRSERERRLRADALPQHAGDQTGQTFSERFVLWSQPTWHQLTPPPALSRRLPRR